MASLPMDLVHKSPTNSPITVDTLAFERVLQTPDVIQCLLFDEYDINPAIYANLNIEQIIYDS
jgi:hypothetical protein